MNSLGKETCTHTQNLMTNAGIEGLRPAHQPGWDPHHIPHMALPTAQPPDTTPARADAPTLGPGDVTEALLSSDVSFTA